MSSSHKFYPTYLNLQACHHARSLAVDKPRRDIHRLEVVWRRRPRPKIWEVLRHERSDATFARADQRGDVPNSIILGEGERKSCISYVNPERAEWQ